MPWMMDYAIELAQVSLVDGNEFRERQEHARHYASWHREWAAAWAGIAWLVVQDVNARQQYALTRNCVNAIHQLRAAFELLETRVHNTDVDLGNLARRFRS